MKSLPSIKVVVASALAAILSLTGCAKPAPAPTPTPTPAPVPAPIPTPAPTPAPTIAGAYGELRMAVSSLSQEDFSL